MQLLFRWRVLRIASPDEQLALLFIEALRHSDTENLLVATPGRSRQTAC